MYSSFEDLDVYKAAIGFTGKIYKLLEKNPLKKDFAMIDQLRRVTISISNNISEGFERETDKEGINTVFYFAKGSAGEVRNLFNVMAEISYFESDELKEYRSQVLDISKQLANYIKHVKRRIE